MTLYTENDGAGEDAEGEKGLPPFFGGLFEVIGPVWLGGGGAG